jgi:hypothetical protein
MMTGTSGRISFILGSISKPVIPGMLMSESTKARACSVAFANATPALRWWWSLRGFRNLAPERSEKRCATPHQKLNLVEREPWAQT